ncbi:MAG: AAC(3) family N-acetyltransferase [Rhodospirillales bacterium]|nr:AAC(3) family N-acetyltransferase [Rhodospirillales bacterium]
MNNLAYNIDDIVEALIGVGLHQGDTAFFSTSLGMLGVAEGVNNQDDLNTLFFEAIKKVLGTKGTILVPAYSYTFGGSTKDNPKIYDPLTTPAEVGPFPNFFIKQKGVVRSLDPMVSVAGLGPGTEALFKDLPPTSYGDDSVFARLVNHPNTKCVSIGLGPNWVPFLHHADWLAQVPFRYDKSFFGGIKQSAGIEYVEWVYAVRALIDESMSDAHELGRRATDKGIWTHAPLGRARVYVCDYKEFFNYTIKLLQDNKWLTAKGPACDVLIKS